MNEENIEDRKNYRRDSFKNKRLDNKAKDIERRDSVKIKKQRKNKMMEIEQDELWEEWENEIY